MTTILSMLKCPLADSRVRFERSGVIAVAGGVRGAGEVVRVEGAVEMAEKRALAAVAEIEIATAEIGVATAVGVARAADRPVVGRTMRASMRC